MKKAIFFFAICFVANALSAQQCSIGPTIGFNYAWMSNVPDGKGLPGINGGVVFVYSTNEHWGFGADARISQEGLTSDFGSVEATTRLTYLRIPMKTTYFFGTMEDNFRPKIYVGPALGFLVGGKTEVVTEQITTKVDSKDFYEPFDLGLTGGLGFNVRLAGNAWLNVDAAYTHGVFNVAKDGPESLNRHVNLNLGVAWGF